LKNYTNMENLSWLCQFHGHFIKYTQNNAHTPVWRFDDLECTIIVVLFHTNHIPTYNTRRITIFSQNVDKSKQSQPLRTKLLLFVNHKMLLISRRFQEFPYRWKIPSETGRVYIIAIMWVDGTSIWRIDVLTYFK